MHMRVCTGSYFAMSLQGLSSKPLATGLVGQLVKLFPHEPLLAVQRAVSDGLIRALQDETIDVQETLCLRDYARLCPDGTCVAQRSFIA